jgi:hypothetical protein
MGNTHSGKPRKLLEKPGFLGIPGKLSSLKVEPQRKPYTVKDSCPLYDMRNGFDRNLTQDLRGDKQSILPLHHSDSPFPLASHLSRGVSTHDISFIGLMFVVVSLDLG